MAFGTSPWNRVDRLAFEAEHFRTTPYRRRYRQWVDIFEHRLTPHEMPSVGRVDPAASRDHEKGRNSLGDGTAPHRMASRFSSRTVIYAALVGNLLVAATKFGAAAWTGSSAMLSEGVHSIVDLGNELLLLYGLHRGAVRPDRDHPLGHGREIYFWSFVVALLVFALGAGVSLYEGITHVLSAEPIQNARVNYVVLGLSALFDGSTWWIALRNFRGEKRYADLFGAIRDSKDPPSFIVLFEDSAALIGLMIAFAGIYFSVKLNLPVLDGVASILIGLVLAVTAALLARETKGLLIGERADQRIHDSILRIAAGMEGVAHANGVLTIHLAPQQILVALSLEFADDLKAPEIEAKVIELERRVHQRHPAVTALFVKPQSSGGFKETNERRYGKLGSSAGEIPPTLA